MTAYSLDVLLFYLEPVCCSMSSSNCCFLTCIQVSQEAGQVVWYSDLFKNFPQFVVIHTVKVFGIVNKADISVFLELSGFLMIQWMLAIWSLIPLPFLKPIWISWSSQFTLFILRVYHKNDKDFSFLCFSEMFLLSPVTHLLICLSPWKFHHQVGALHSVSWCSNCLTGLTY